MSTFFKNINVSKLVAQILVMTTFVMSAPIVFNPTQAEAAINKQINYQGKLTNLSNIAVTDGNYNMIFSLYTAPSGGAPLWTENKLVSSAQGVTVTNGLFSTMLGSVATLAGVDFNQTLYLGVTIGGTGTFPSWDSEMSPRKIIGSVPSAFTADNIQGVTPGQFFRSDIANSTSTTNTYFSITNSGAGNIADFIGASAVNALTIKSTGKVGIGTTSPTSQLDVSSSGTTGNLQLNLNSTTSGGEVGYIYSRLGVAKAEVGVAGTAGQVLTTSGVDDLAFKAYSSTGNILFGTTLSSTERMRITSAGLVGIGTTTPSGRLAISGVSDNSNTLIIGSSGGSSLTVDNNGRLYTGVFAGTYSSLDASMAIGGRPNVPTIISRVGSGTKNQVWQNSGGTEVANVASDGGAYFAGNVGIGTSTPWKNFSVNGDMVLTGRFYDSLSSAGTNGMVLQTTGSATKWVATSSLGFASASQIGSGTQGQVSFYNAAGSNLTATSSIFIAQSGNIGIGTANPGYKLDVNGNARFQSPTASPSTFTGTNPQLNITDGTSGTSGFYQASANGSFGLPTAGDFGVFGPQSVYIVTNNNSINTTFKSNGNVGIGTTSPYAKLSVAGSLALTGAFYDSLSSAGTNGMVLQTTGTATKWVATSSLGFASASQIGSGTQGQVSFYNAAGTNLTATSSLFIAQSGNIGIGTTTPAQKLDVLGNIQVEGTNANILLNPYGGASESSAVQIANARMQIGYDGATSGTGFIMTGGGRDFRILTNAGTEVSRFTSGGNVGIGTTSPSQKLSVTGNIYSSGTASFGGGIGSALYLNDNPLYIRGVGDTNHSISYVNNGTIDGVHIKGYNGVSLQNNTVEIFNGSYAKVNGNLYATGNVGVGTTSPYAKLSVTGSFALTGAFYDSLASAGTNGMVLQTTGSGTQWVATSSLGFASASQIGSGTQGQVPFYNVAGSNLIATSSLFIAQSGNVGIGTTTANKKLTVGGGLSIDADASGYGLYFTSGINPSGVSLTVSGGNKDRLSISHPTYVPGIYSPYNSGSTFNFISGDIITMNTASNERFRITSAGNIGIGSSTPATTLSVNGSGYISSGLGVGVLNTAAGTLVTSGNASIGGQLKVGNSTSGYIYAIDGFHSITLREGGSDVTRLREFGGTIASGKGIFFNTASTDRMQIADDGVKITGNLGIGVTPQSLLDLGNASINSLGQAILTGFETGGFWAYPGYFAGDSVAGVNTTDGSASFANALATISSTGGIKGNSFFLNPDTIGGLTAGFVGDGLVDNSFRPTLEFGLNAAQLGNRDINYQGGLFRLDSRSGFPFFSVINDRENETGGGGNEYAPLQITSNGSVLLGNGWGVDNNTGTGSGEDLQVNGNTYLGGNVGIGTSPGYTLDVAGNFNVADNDGSSIRMANTDISIYANNVLKLDGEAAIALNTITGANVGIGTTTPGSLLSVQGNGLFSGNIGAANITATGTISASGLNVLNTSLAYNTDGIYAKFGVGPSNDPYQRGIVFGNKGTANNPYIQGIYNNGANTQNLLINPDGGNVGIGTTSPYAKLSVAGTIVGASFVSTTTATSTFGGGLNLASGCYAVNGVCLTNSTASGNVLSGTVGQIPYYAGSGTTLTATSSLFLATSGNIGIGTTTPGTMLTLGSGGVISLSGGNTLINMTGSSAGINFNGQLLRHRTGGNPGDGLYTPANLQTQSQLFIGSDSTGVGLNSSGVFGILEQRMGTTANGYRVYNTYTNATNYERGVLDWNNTSGVFRIGTENSGTGVARRLDFITASTTRLTIDTAGNVGVGTTSPYAKLSVSGSLALTGAFYDSTASSGTNGMVLQTTGAATQWVATSSLGFASSGSVAALTSSMSSNSVPKWNGSSFVNSLASDNGTTMTVNGNLSSSKYFLGNDLGLFPVAGGQSVVQTYWAMQLAGQTGSIPSSYTASNVGISVSDYHVVLPMVNTNAAGFAILGVGSQTKNYLEITSNANKTSSSLRGDIFSVSSAGNVGIGTSTPYAKLSVAGTVVGQNFVGTSTATSSFMGGVGIGTASPSTMLHVKSTVTGINNLLTLEGGVSGIGQGAAMVFTNTYGAAGRIRSSTAVASGLNDLVFEVNNTNTEAMRILSNGNVGIGTTSPSATLSVNGNAYITGTTSASRFSAINGSALTLDATAGGINSNGAAVINTSGIITKALDIQWQGSTRWSMGWAGDLSSNVSSGVVPLTIGSQFVVKDVTSGGYVGIGTASPTKKLEVNGTVRFLNASNDGMMSFSNGGYIFGDMQYTTGMWIGQTANFTSGISSFINTSNGSIGLDSGQITSNGSGQLTVGSLKLNGALTDSLNSTGTNGMVLQTTGSATKWVATSSLGFASASQIGSGTQGQFPYYAGSGTTLTATSSLFVATTGNVGVGNIAPQVKLQVSANNTSGTLPQFLVTGATNTNAGMSFGFNTSANVGSIQSLSNISGSTGSQLLVNPLGGNVGIGITGLPLSKLDVNGGVAIGTYAGVTAAPSNGMIVSGNVGIGNDSPSYALTIGSNIAGAGSGAISFSNANGTMVAQATSASGYSGMNMYDSSGNLGGSFQYGNSGSAFPNTFFFGNRGTGATQIVAGSGATPVMTILNNGNVGIGNTNPSSKLQIAGTTGITFGYNSAENQPAQIYADSGDNLNIVSSTGFGKNVIINGYSFGPAGLAFTSGYANGFMMNLTFNPGGTAGTAGGYSFGGTNTETSGTFRGISLTPTYNQTSSTAANTDLYINRTDTAVGSGGQYLIDARTNNLSKFSVTNTGNVGIGTSSPYARLSVAGNVVANNFVATSTTGISSMAGYLSVNNFGAVSISDNYSGISTLSQFSAAAQDSYNVNNTTAAIGARDSNNTVATFLGYDDSYNCYYSCGALGVVSSDSNGDYAILNDYSNQIAVTGFSSGNLGGSFYGATTGVNSSGGVYGGVFYGGTAGIHVSGSSYGVFSSSGTNYLAGNTGIGTTSPAQKLSVSGNTYVTGGVGIGAQNSTAGTLLVQTSSYTSNQVLINNGVTSGVPAYPGGLTPTLAVQVAEVSGSRPLFFGYGNGSAWGSTVDIGACGSFSQMCFNMGYGTAHNSALVNNGNNLAIGGNSNTGFSAVDGNYNNVYFGNTGNTLIPNGNVGIGTISPGFPLNFANTLGDKIALWGNTGAHYGFGIQSGLLQIHTDGTGGDVGFGYGSSGSFTQNVTFKGTGNVGIGTTTPYAKLSVSGTIVGSNFVGTTTSASSLGGALSVTGALTARSSLTMTNGIFTQTMPSSAGTPSFVLNNTKGDGNIFEIYERGRATFKNYSNQPGFVISSGAGSNGESVDVLQVFQSGGWNGSNYALNVSGYSNLNGFRVNGSDAANSLYAANGGSMGFTVNNGNAITFSLFGGGGEKMRLNGNGNVGIGTTSPASTLTVAGSACISGGAGSTAACSTTAGTITARVFNTANADLAENYQTSDASISAGDIVAVDLFNDISIIKATSTSSVIGIVSTQPGMLLGADESNAQLRAVALAGRVPVKVSVENGEIKRGDSLTVSSVPGVAAKYNGFGPVIGTALTAASSNGTVTVFVKAGFQNSLADAITSTSTLSMNSSITDLLSAAMQSTGQWIGKRVVAFQGIFQHVETVDLQAETVNTKNLCLEGICITKDQFKNLLEKNGIGVTSAEVTPSPTPSSSPVITPSPEVSTTTPTTSPEPQVESPASSSVSNGQVIITDSPVVIN